MSVDIKVPVLPESVAEATIAAWHKKPGEAVARDESLVDIETDKVVLEVVAPADGVLDNILKEAGATVGANEVIATFTAGAKATATSVAAKEAPAVKSASAAEIPAKSKDDKPSASVVPGRTQQVSGTSAATPIRPQADDNTQLLSPSARRAITEGADNVQAKTNTATPQIPKQMASPQTTSSNRIEKRVPMSRLRARIAERLLEAQQNAAILTTFNEINMQPVMALRSKYKDEFEEKYGVRLGFMSFFVTAVVAALKKFPAVNASIDGPDIVYHGYFDIGIAVSTPRGLVVPILRDADTLSMAEIEIKIKEFSKQAQDGKIALEDITGGTFTITNGGVFGSLMATPILNPPQSGILGMHKIEERPVVENKEIVIRPMMYVALSYDHRIIDGAESVQFLVAVKELLEEPARLLLSV